MNRLILRHLTFIGPNVEPASVDFSPGTTVIRGPSDTGKSFIVDAIDFMLGSTKLKKIPQRDGYATALLGLTLPSGDVVTISRSLNGGSFGLYNGEARSFPSGLPSVTLAALHNGDKRGSLSRFLLSEIELDGKRIRKNVNNETDSLSFRHILPLCLVDETRMQSETPPTLSGNPVRKTRETSTFKLLIENVDDSGLVEISSKKDRSRIVNAKAEVVDQLLADLERQVRDAGSLADLQDRSARLTASITIQLSAIAGLNAKRADLNEALVGAERRAMEIRRQIEDSTALDARFRLLLQQYTSDLMRLEMIAEAGTLLGYFSPGRCVFCGADPEHQHLNEGCPEDTTYFRESVEAEQSKTKALRADLLDTLQNLAGRQDELASSLEELDEVVRVTGGQIKELDDALLPRRGDLGELLDARSQVERHLAAYEQIEKLNELNAAIASEGQNPQAEKIASLNSDRVSELSGLVASRLTAWGVPDAEQVRYDPVVHDIIAGGQLRSAHGKGVRAILHAAFTISLAQFCFKKELPHPGFVILDSPLVTYRPPEEGEQIDPSDRLDVSVAARFYADIQENFDGQIIVMENMDPPNGLRNESVDISFTKSATSGRYGFFPHNLTLGVDQEDSVARNAAT